MTHAPPRVVVIHCVTCTSWELTWLSPKQFPRKKKKNIFCHLGVSENSVCQNPMVLLIIIPMKYGYFIGNIPYFQTNPFFLLLQSPYPSDPSVYGEEATAGTSPKDGPNEFRPSPFFSPSFSGWWCNITILKNDGVRQIGKDDNPYMKWKILKYIKND